MMDTVTIEMMARAAAEIGVAVFLKATLLVTAAGVVALLLRRSSAAARQLAWSTVFVILVVLPLVSFTVPSWQFGSLEEIWLDAKGPTGVSHTTSLDPEPVGERSTTAPNAAKTSESTTDNKPFEPSPLRMMALILLGFWGIGVLLNLVRLTIHLLRVCSLTHRAHPLDPSDVSSLPVPLATRLGLLRSVRCLVSDNISIPFAWGIFRPVIIFPPEVRTWNEEQTRSVLLHELAHIARWDYLLHLLTQIACAFYWPNPLVWLASRRSAMERERACDDYALQQGVRNHEYASYLLQVARSHVKRARPMYAVTMARENGLKERIRCVMNEKLNHTSLSTEKFVLITLALMVLMLPFITLDVFGVRQSIPVTGDLIMDLEAHRDPIIRQRAAWWLGEHEDHDAVIPLTEALRDGSADVRQVAAWALGEIKDKKSIVPLIWALEDSDPRVREMAILSLGEIEDPVAIDPLVEISKREKDMRTAVVWALGEIENRGSRKAGWAREEIFADWNWRSWENDQVWAGTLMNGPLVKRVTDGFRADEGAIDYTESVPSLLRRLEDKKPDMRREAAFNCGLIGIRDTWDSLRDIERIVDALLETLRDPEPEVRAMAVWALDEINPSRSHHFRRDRDHYKHDYDHEYERDHRH
ncbi:MAG: HEAT repeat domain-containing protein [Gemmatimonadota bacterium]|nr:MAG: HEAT repeat domain-containing protein [Gemmatimonadota bacterium]